MKNHRKIFGICIIAVFCAVILAGCSSAFDSGSSNNANYVMPQMEESYVYDSADYDYAMEYEGERFDLFLLSANAASTGSNLPADRKIIRDANITLEVEDVEKSYENILITLSGLGGYEADRNMSSGSNNYVRINATLKIPAGNLDGFLDGLKNEGNVISSNISSADITDQYFDSQTRLTTLEKTLENYYRFLENAQDVDEQLKVTRYINDITQEIEKLKGSLKRWDSLVDYSTVTLNLYRPYEAPKPERVIQWDSLTIDDMGWYISSGFLGVCNFIFSLIQWFIIAIVTISPVLVPVIILIFLLIRYQKKKNKQYIQNKTKTVNPAGNPPEDNK